MKLPDYLWVKREPTFDILSFTQFLTCKMQLRERVTLEYQNILYEEYFQFKKINIHEDLTPPQSHRK